MKQVMTAALLGLGLMATSAAPATADEASELRSYSTSWQEGPITWRAVMFPHEVDGCKRLIQSRKVETDEQVDFVELEGPDCDCNLVIDGQEERFRAATGYASRKLLAVCNGPAVDGNERKLVIMRESLKLVPDYSKIPNVKAR